MIQWDIIGIYPLVMSKYLRLMVINSELMVINGGYQWLIAN